MDELRDTLRERKWTKKMHVILLILITKIMMPA